jgi:iron complex transport system ATP-binding protein
MSILLEGRELYFRYGNREVLKTVTIEIPGGRFTVILGRNGSGKSTLLRIAAGLLKPERGTLQAMGRDLNRLSLSERAKIIGYLPQFHRPVFPFAVEDVVLTGRASYVNLMPRERDRSIALGALERVGISHLRARPFTELSGGEQQLVLIARVLAQEPKLILLDEPTTHLDLLNQARLLRLVKEFVTAGLAVVAVLHDPNLAFLYGDRFVFLRDGEAETWDSFQKPWNTEILRRVYGTRVCSIPYRDRALVISEFDWEERE